MAGIAVRTIDGKSASLSPEALGALRGGLRGSLCLPGEAGYDEARTLWNAMIDKRPAAVVRALGANDVIQTVRLAAQHGLVLSVRGGGHTSRETPCATGG